MNLYGIKVVPPEWEETMPLPFGESVYDAAKLEQGTRVLIFRPGEGIVGEGEVAGFAIRPAEWKMPNPLHLPAALAQVDYLQPVRLLYTRKDSITAEQVRKVLNEPLFPASSDVWRSLDRDVYQQLANWPY